MDTVTVDTITGSPVVATDDIGGVHYQLVKVSMGALDANEGPVSSSNPFPVSLVAGNNNVGDVDVASVTPGNGAANLGKTIDSVAGASDTGVAVLAKRVDTPATITPAVGDWAALQVDSQGSLRVNITSGGAQAQIDDATFTPGTSEVVVVGFFADEATTDSIDEGEQGAARMTLDRKQIVTSYVHAAAGGATPYKNLDCDETEDEIKGSAGKLYWIHCINLAATKRYLKFYNATAANVTVGTTTPVLTFPIPTFGDTNGTGFAINFGAMGVQFDTAITVAATTGFADNDTGAPGANEVIMNAGYA